MAEVKTTRNKRNVQTFLRGIKDDQRRADAKALLAMMKKISGKKPEMWGSSIVGFGSYHYRYESGREGEWPPVAFSPRKQNVTIYVAPNLDAYRAPLKTLGKYKRGVGCLYVKRLDDVHMPTLRRLISQAVAWGRKRA
jgi:hypothetical protein